MFAKVLLLVLSMMPMAAAGEAGLWDKVKGIFFTTHTPPPTIDVLIVNDQPSVMLELKGKYHIYDPNTKQHISTRFVGKRKHLQAISSGLKWGEEFPGIYQLHIVPDTEDVVSVVDGVEYTGSLFVYDIGGTISIVNRTSIEDYLSSTLPEQFHDHLPEETSAAIAIAARTNAYYLSLNKKNHYWAVDAQQAGYKGLQAEHTAGEMERAIKATTHMVMTLTGKYEGKVTPFAAQWGSVTGGQVGRSQAVFSHISLHEAEEMGQNGKHAAQILAKAFPNTHIELIQ